MKLIYLLYDSKVLSKRNRAPILYSTDNFETILDVKENQFPKSALYIYESEEKGAERKQIGKIKCYTCKKDILIVDNELTKCYPFCGPVCQLQDYVGLLELGKDEKVEELEYDNIE